MSTRNENLKEGGTNNIFKHAQAFIANACTWSWHAVLRSEPSVNAAHNGCAHTSVCARKSASGFTVCSSPSDQLSVAHPFLDGVKVIREVFAGAGAGRRVDGSHVIARGAHKPFVIDHDTQRE